MSQTGICYQSKKEASKKTTIEVDYRKVVIKMQVQMNGVAIEIVDEMDFEEANGLIHSLSHYLDKQGSLCKY